MAPPRPLVLEVLYPSAQMHGMTPDMSPRGPRRRHPRMRPKAKRVTFRLDRGSEVIPEIFEAGAPRSTEDLAAQNLSSIVENHEQLMRTLGGIVALFAGDSDSDKADKHDTGSSNGFASTPLERVCETTSRIPGQAEVIIHSNVAKLRANHKKVKRALLGCFSWSR
mmetsp:Transcript_126784/g.370617  ORF Transcript_126784/g.370617 Transcript_126784/m.370617 type:complete len:166 (-) Transcript_126784:215-712(-)